MAYTHSPYTSTYVCYNFASIFDKTVSLLWLIVAEWNFQVLFPWLQMEGYDDVVLLFSGLFWLKCSCCTVQYSTKSFYHSTKCWLTCPFTSVSILSFFTLLTSYFQAGTTKRITVILLVVPASRQVTVQCTVQYSGNQKVLYTTYSTIHVRMSITVNTVCLYRTSILDSILIRRSMRK